MINNLGYYIMISNQIEEESTGSISISIKSLPKTLIEWSPLQSIAILTNWSCRMRMIA